MNQKPSKPENLFVQKNNPNGFLIIPLLIFIVGISITTKSGAQSDVATVDSKSANETQSSTNKEITDAPPSKLMPYSADLRDRSNINKIIEWTLRVSEVNREGENKYQINVDGSPFINGIDEYQVEIATNNDEERKVIESMKRGEFVEVKGRINWNEGHIMVVAPAIINTKRGNLTASLLKELADYKKSPIDLEEITDDIRYKESMTSLQRDSLKDRLMNLRGKIVEGTIQDYTIEKSPTPCFWLLSSKNRLNMSLHLHFRNEKELAAAKEDVLHKSTKPLIGEYNDPKPIRFRGFIDYIKPAEHDVDSANICIGPAIILLNADEHASADKPGREPASDKSMHDDHSEIKSDHNSNHRRNEISSVMPGERYPETRLRRLNPAEVNELNLNDVRYAINEMYARRGAVFKNAEIAKSFANKEWFKPRPGVTFQEIEAEFTEIESDNLRLLGKERHLKSASADLYELIDSESNIREGPGTNYAIIRKSQKGELGARQSVEMGWIKLQFADGSMGWAHEKNVKSKR